MDDNQFFRAGTLAICGDLDIGQATRSCVVAIRERLPVDRMFLQVLEPDLGAMRTIATATAEEGKRVDLLTPLAQQSRHAERQARGRLEPGRAYVIEEPEQQPIASEMLRAHGIEGWSILIMHLTTVDRHIGSVVLAADGKGRYDEGHVALLESLKEPFTIALHNTLEHLEVLRLRDRLADDKRFLSRELQRLAGDEIVGAEFGLKEVMRLAYQVAPTESPVLLSGETGVGKDVLANAIHLASSRRDGPFIAVNCGAIPESLLDSELFGHERGAFTGALALKRGRFERAHGGTIFLDEIGEMPLDAQVRLLRVLQNREIERIGGTRRIPLDIRVLAATNKDLQQQVKQGAFREDLWFRLNVFPIPIPPLRERPQDIPALVRHFLERKARQLKLSVTPELADGAIEALLSYAWPGNVRELENLIERAMIIYPEQPLRFDLPGLPAQLREVPEASSGKLLSLDEVAARQIRRALELSGGKIHGPGGAGELLRINPNTLRHRMRKYGIPFKRS